MIKKHRAWVIFHIPRSVRPLLKRFSLITLVVISLLLIFLSRSESPALAGLRNFSLKILSPIIIASEGVSGLASGIFSNTSDYFFVYDKNQELTADNQALKRILLSLQEQEEENKRLRDLLKFAQEPFFIEKSARVVGNTGGVFLNTILINAGKEDSVVKGQAVVSEHGLVGRIIEVSDKVSRVLLISDINSKIPVITSSSRERSILKGNGTSPTELLYLKKESRIEDGEHILTSGDGEVYPAGIQIGNVKKESDGRYIVVPFTAWNTLEFVSILQKQSDSPLVNQ